LAGWSISTPPTLPPDEERAPQVRVPQLTRSRQSRMAEGHQSSQEASCKAAEALISWNPLGVLAHWRECERFPPPRPDHPFILHIRCSSPRPGVPVPSAPGTFSRPHRGHRCEHPLPARPYQKRTAIGPPVVSRSLLQSRRSANFLESSWRLGALATEPQGYYLESTGNPLKIPTSRPPYHRERQRSGLLVPD
jgi:hypothetical protein